jgi:hypothetical protein
VDWQEEHIGHIQLLICSSVVHKTTISHHCAVTIHIHTKLEGKNNKNIESMCCGCFLANGKTVLKAINKVRYEFKLDSVFAKIQISVMKL